MTRLLLLLIAAYRRLLSPLLGQRCRFHPSCSEYAHQAISMHGTAMGSWMAVKRILRCQPFCEGGLDPVPQQPPALFDFRRNTEADGSVDLGPDPDQKRH